MSLPFHDYQRVEVKFPPGPTELLAFRWVNRAMVFWVLACSIGAIWSGRLSPGLYGHGLVNALYFAVGTAGGLVGTACLLAYRYMSYAESTRIRLKALIPSLIIVTMFLFVCLVNLLDIPFKVAFAVSRSSLERLAISARDMPTVVFAPQYAGLLPIDRIIVDGSRVRMHIENGDGISMSADLIWSPNDPPPKSVISSDPLGGGWYYVQY